MAPTDAAPQPLAEPGAAVSALLVGVRAALVSAQSVRLTDYEEREGEALGPLLEEVRACVDAAASVLAEALVALDAAAPPTPAPAGNLCDEVDRRMLDPASVEKAAGLVFIARFALQGHAATLRGIRRDAPAWETLSTCGGAVREVQKSLSALEVALCELLGVAPRASFYLTELERSLRVRYAYACFRADLLRAGPPDPTTLPQRMRRAASAIAKLVGREIYPSARVHDRWMLRQFQRRIRAWMQHQCAQHGTSEAHTVSGMRLWDELANVAELVMQVNHRAELRAHDAATLDAVLAQSTTAPLTHDHLQALQTLWGRDAQLDALLDGRHAPDDPRWPEVLRQSRARLGRVSPASQPPGGTDARPHSARTSFPPPATHPLPPSEVF